MDFDERLQKAVARGRQTRSTKAGADAAKALSVDELRNLHSACRLELSEHIENCLRKLEDQFPGFEFQSVVGEEGWGATLQRDDVGLAGGKSPTNFYSRLELLIRPFSDTHIVALTGKGTIRNKETLSREHFQFLADVDPDSFRETIDLWIVEYAEKYASAS